MSAARFPAAAFDNEVLYTVERGVALITLNAPRRMNSMGAKMNHGVTLALDLAAEDDDVRCVVLTGAGGRAFSVGGDLFSATDGASTGFRAKDDDPLPDTVTMSARRLRVGMASSEALREMDKPTIAAVNGACAGAGMCARVATGTLRCQLVLHAVPRVSQVMGVRVRPPLLL